MTSDYRLTAIDGPCKDCGRPLVLLYDNLARPGWPAFFICWYCRRANEASKGPVPGGDPEEFETRYPKAH